MKGEVRDLEFGDYPTFVEWAWRIIRDRISKYWEATVLTANQLVEKIGAVMVIVSFLWFSYELVHALLLEGPRSYIWWSIVALVSGLTIHIISGLRKEYNTHVDDITAQARRRRRQTEMTTLYSNKRRSWLRWKKQDGQDQDGQDQ